MKVFISWSGDLSHEVARAIRNWLPKVLTTVKPYVSSEDIAKGMNGLEENAAQLKSSKFGILCITRESIKAPWLNYEAGALSNSVGPIKISPFLISIARSEIRDQPIENFQSTVPEKDDVLKLLFSINESSRDDMVDRLALTSIFEERWPELKEQLKWLIEKYSSEHTSPLTATMAGSNEMLNELNLRASSATPTSISACTSFFKIKKHHKELHIFALSGQKFLDEIDRHRMFVDSIKIISPTDDALKAYYGSNQKAISLIKDDIDNIVNGTTIDSLKPRVKKIETKRIGSFPLSFYAISSERIAMSGVYTDSPLCRHTIGLTSSAWVDLDSNSVSGKLSQFKGLWECAESC